MKAIRVAMSAAGIAAMVAVVASGQTALVAADGELKAEAVADTNGNLHVPNAYRTRYEFFGTWAVAAVRARVRKSFTSSMCRPEPSPPIAETDIFPMARYS